MKTISRCLFFCLPALTAAVVAPAAASDARATLAISQRQFVPQTLSLPAGQKVRVTVRNHDKIPAEFESYDLSREVVVPPGGTVQLYVGPLKPGKYNFFDDFNPNAKGWIVVEAGHQETRP